MARKRITKKEIKKPDEFVSFWVRAYEYAQEHSRTVIVASAAIVAVAALAWSLHAYHEKKARDSSRLLSKAQMALLAGREGASGEKNRGEAESILTDLTSRYKSTPAALVARVLLGNVYYQRGDFEKSIETYRSLAALKPKDPMLRAMAYEGLAYSYEQKGDWAGALASYQELAASQLEHFSQEGMWGMARCYEREGKPENALDVYRQFLAKYPQSPRAEEARVLVARISSTLNPPAKAQASAAAADAVPEAPAGEPQGAAKGPPQGAGASR